MTKFLPLLLALYLDQPLPTFPLPTSEFTYQDWPQKNWSSAMKHLIQLQFQCSRCSAIKVYRLDLGTLGPAALIDQPDTPCEAQANECENWVVLYRYHGKYVLDELEGNGWATSMKGSGTVPDLIAGTDYPCCSGHATRYTFKSGHFTPSGCDEIGYDDFGSFKGADVKPCN